MINEVKNWLFMDNAPALQTEETEVHSTTIAELEWSCPGYRFYGYSDPSQSPSLEQQLPNQQLLPGLSIFRQLAVFCEKYKGCSHRH